jgi:hypothetical protein
VSVGFWWRRVWQSLLSTEVWLWINPLGFCPLRTLGISVIAKVAS